MNTLFPIQALHGPPRPPMGRGMMINALRHAVRNKGHIKVTLARAALKAAGVKA